MTNHRKPGNPTNLTHPLSGNEIIVKRRLDNHYASVSEALNRACSLRGLPLFPLGNIVATPGAIDLLDRTGTNASHLLARHQLGDWGVVCSDDALENNRALQDGNRLLSAYDIGEHKERLWIITEHDRSVTTLLLPEEY